jgi:hypothetical protein
MNIVRVFHVRVFHVRVFHVRVFHVRVFHVRVRVFHVRVRVFQTTGNFAFSSNDHIRFDEVCTFSVIFSAHNVNPL